MKAIILCAGYATRLYPLTLNQPKPLLPIGKELMLEHILKKLTKLSEENILDEIIIVTNDKFFPQFQSWKNNYNSKQNITLLNDKTKTNEERLGAVGTIFHVLNKLQIDDDLIVIAGDNLFELDMYEMYKKFKQKDSSIIAIYDLLEKQKLSKKFGVILTNHEGKIIDFEEKPEFPKSSLTATAMYMLKKTDIELILNHHKQFERLDNMGDMIKLLSKQSNVYTLILDNWMDIGSKEDYEKANEIYKMN
ncbi:MAG: nucleotidyltransferase family protein [Candidatus Woesearchaeota archaeon]